MTHKIDRERWRQLQAEFGQDQEPNLTPTVHLGADSLTADYEDGEGDVAAWATRQSMRVDTGALSLYVGRGRVLLLKRLGPYPIESWEILYDSNDDSPVTRRPTIVSCLTSGVGAETEAETMGDWDKGRLALQNYVIAKAEHEWHSERVARVAQEMERQRELAWAWLILNGPTEVRLVSGARFQAEAGTAEVFGNPHPIKLVPNAP